MSRDCSKPKSMYDVSISIKSQIWPIKIEAFFYIKGYIILGLVTN